MLFLCGWPGTVHLIKKFSDGFLNISIFAPSDPRVLNGCILSQTTYQWKPICSAFRSCTNLNFEIN